MLDRLINLANHLGAWGYLIIFLVVVLECQALLGLFIPGESLVIAGGFLAAQGVFEPYTLIVGVSLAAILGDSISFELGRRLGRAWLVSPRRLRLWPKLLSRVETFFHRHGDKSVFAGHFLHVMRALMPFVAGMSRMNYPRFLVFNTAGCVVWATFFVLLGYFVGASWVWVAKWVGHAGAVIAGVLVLVMVWVWFWWKEAPKEPPSPEP